eukprot:1034682-Prorocentrum_minimum.AAC.1
MHAISQTSIYHTELVHFKLERGPRRATIRESGFSSSVPAFPHLPTPSGILPEFVKRTHTELKGALAGRGPPPPAPPCAGGGGASPPSGGVAAGGVPLCVLPVRRRFGRLGACGCVSAVAAATVLRAVPAALPVQARHFRSHGQVPARLPPDQ